MSNKWYIYILRCADHSLYTGITNDLARRLNEHATQDSKSAKYMRGKTPFELVFQFEVDNRSIATKIEYKIKHLSRENKLALIADPHLINRFID